MTGLYSGNKPGEEYVSMGTIDSGRWGVFGKDNGDFLSIKIVLLEGMARKANFWISYVKPKDSFMYRNDTYTLIEEYPEILSSICEIIGTTPESATRDYDPTKRSKKPFSFNHYKKK